VGWPQRAADTDQLSERADTQTEHLREWLREQRQGDAQPE